MVSGGGEGWGVYSTSAWGMSEGDFIHWIV